MNNKQHPIDEAIIVKQRRKKTVVIKRIERRAPSGTLLSSTKSKTVYMGEVDFSLLDNDNLESSKIAKPSLNSQLVETEPNSSKPKPVENFYNYMFEPRRIYKRTELDWRCPKVSDDDSSTTQSNDTCLKDSRLIRRHSAQFDTLMPDLKILIDRINFYRRLNHVMSLWPDNYLMQAAKKYASQLVLDPHTSSGKEKIMNIWTGRTVSEDIVDEWNHEMNSYWDENYFKRKELRRIGIGRCTAPTLHLQIVVAIYE